MDEIDISLKKMDEHVKKVIAQESLPFWLQYFPTQADASDFIKNCLKKFLTRRMMLRTEWYVEIADKMPKIHDSRPALQVIFLVALAEGIARRRFTKKEADDMGPTQLVIDFFRYIIGSDKKELEMKFRRSLTSTGYHQLYISSIIRILYQVRNDAVHGEDYWDFSLVDTKRHKDAHEPHWRLMTSGWLGPRKRKRRITVETKLTYENLRDIFIRTAIQNIQLKF